MPTKIFLSWSGELSRNIADTLKEWLPLVIQETEPFFSEIDIDKGSVGIEKILSNLKESKVSIIVLTKENTSKPWILFEAGCIHGHGGAACSLLINLQTEDTAAPLQQLQQTRFNKKDIYQLIQTINSKCEKPLKKDILRKSFDAHWANLQQKVDDLLKQNTQIQKTELESTNEQIRTVEDELTWKKCQIHSIKKIASELDPEYKIEGKLLFHSEPCDTNAGLDQIGIFIFSYDPSVNRDHKLWLIDKGTKELLYSYPKPENDYDSKYILSEFGEKYCSNSSFLAYPPFSEHAQTMREEEWERKEREKREENAKAIKRYDRFFPQNKENRTDEGKISFMNHLHLIGLQSDYLDSLPDKEARKYLDTCIWTLQASLRQNDPQ